MTTPSMPRRVAVLTTALFLMSHVTALRAASCPADDARISYEGRTAPGTDHQVRLGFPGIVVRVRASAPELHVRIEASSDTVLFNLAVDGKDEPRVQLKKGANDVVLCRGLAAGTHEIELTRRNESWQGVCAILGFDAPGGAILAAPALPQRKLMFIGDSITCGEGTEPEASPDSRSPLREDAAASFGMKLARRFHAQCELVSYGGRGVIRDWQGIRATTNAPQFYELALPDDPTARWDPSRYVPDAIGICLGTNDFSQGIPDQNEFVNAYVEFIRKIQRDAPKAPIFLIDSPILTDGPGQPPKRTALGAYIDEVVTKVGSPLVQHAVVSHYKGAPDNAHPTGADHTGIANELEPVFRKALGW